MMTSTPARDLKNGGYILVRDKVLETSFVTVDHGKVSLTATRVIPLSPTHTQVDCVLDRI